MTGVPLYALIGVLILIVAIATLYSAIHVVEEGDVEAMLVLGQMRTVLHPGLHIVPPFVSETHPIERTSMLIDKGHERVEVPAEFEDDVLDGPDRTSGERSTG